MKKNFTLIELLVVIAIIAILAGLVMPALGHAQAKGRTTECINNKKQVMTVLRMYGNDHTSMIPYMINVKDDKNPNGIMRPYSWILAGFGQKGAEQYSTEMISKKVLICNTLNKKELFEDKQSDGYYGPKAATNAVGMIDVDFGTQNTGWYDVYKNTVGRFVAKDATSRTANGSVAYVLEKIKNPSDMILLADSFTVDTSDQESAVWTFNPNGGAPKYNNATTAGSDEARIATVHAGGTTVAYADGRAESLTAAQLGTSAIKVTKYYDDNFAQKDL